MDKHAHRVPCLTALLPTGNLALASKMPPKSNDYSSDEPPSNKYDYIIVGGGIAGCVVASRLHERHPKRTVLLIEAGQVASKHPLVPPPLAAPLLRGSELDWNYSTVPQRHLEGRCIYEGAGKALGGGSVINAGIASSSFS
jgi:choline dehydrogenase-like flavoprotein